MPFLPLATPPLVLGLALSALSVTAHTAAPVVSAPAPSPAQAQESQQLTAPAAIDSERITREPPTVTYEPPIVWPVEATTEISDVFGPRTSPTAGASTDHQGVDFAAALGTPVHAAARGVVTQVTGDVDGCGVSITLRHDLSLGAASTRYCHLGPGTIQVTTGATVAAGEVIAAVGNSGTSTGAHLHLEVRNGANTPFDPLGWLPHPESATPDME